MLPGMRRRPHLALAARAQSVRPTAAVSEMRSQTLCLGMALGLAGLSPACATSTGRPAPDLPPTPIGIAPFELHNAHVYVRVRVADSGSTWFILDTGGSTTLDSATAISLGRAVLRTETGSGGGEAAFAVRLIDGVPLRLVDAAGQSVAVLPAQRVATVDLSPVAQAEGRPLAGILGGSFFARYAVVIDYDRRQLEVYPRRGFRGPAGWIAVPLRVQGDLVSARGAVTLRSGERAIPGLVPRRYRRSARADPEHTVRVAARPRSSGDRFA
jgi:hypothetical protein